MKSLAVLDPTDNLMAKQISSSVNNLFAEKANENSKSPQELWAQNHCVVLHHESGTGRTLVCHSKKTDLADGIISFLNANVDALTTNCEFLARHLRYERESIKRFIDNTKKSGMLERRRRRRRR